MTVAITGATGLLGSALVDSFRADAIPVIRIGRGQDADVVWDPLAGELDGEKLRGVDVVVHLAGENVGNRWTPERKRAIRESRIRGTTLVARTIAALPVHPRVMLSASGTGIYGAHRGDEILTEASSLGDDFLAQVVREWEGATEPAQTAGIRVAYLRSGVALARGAGMLGRLLPIFSLGLGGRVGSGAQWLSWITRRDWVRAVRFLIDSNLAGPFNIATPNPVTNAAFTDALGHVLRRPTLAVAPAFAIKLVYGEMGADTVLASQRAIPERLRSAGFSFDFPDIIAALEHEIGKRS